MFKALKSMAHDFVEHFPDDDRGMVSIACDHFSGFAFETLFSVGCDLWSVIHTFDRQCAYKEDTHFISQIIYNLRLWFTPGANHVGVAVFDKLEFFFEQFKISRICEGMRIKGFVEGSFENDFFAIEVESFCHG